MTDQQVNCPRCDYRLCDRTPTGIVAGTFLCRKCKLEVLIESLGFAESYYVIVSHEQELRFPVYDYRRRESDGHALIPWGIFLTVGMAGHR